MCHHCTSKPCCYRSLKISNPECILIIFLCYSLSKTSLKTLSRPISLKNPCHFFINTHWVQLIKHMYVWTLDHTLRHRQPTCGRIKSTICLPESTKNQWLMDGTSITSIPSILVFTYSLTSSSYNPSSPSFTILSVSQDTYIYRLFLSNHSSLCSAL